MTAVMLTTKDNPFDPFTDFDSWFMYDSEKGYNTCGLIDRIARTSNALSDAENFLFGVLNIAINVALPIKYGTVPIVKNS